MSQAESTMPKAGLQWSSRNSLTYLPINAFSCISMADYDPELATKLRMSISLCSSIGHTTTIERGEAEGPGQVMALPAVQLLAAIILYLVSSIIYYYDEFLS